MCRSVLAIGQAPRNGRFLYLGILLAFGLNYWSATAAYAAHVERLPASAMTAFRISHASLAGLPIAPNEKRRALADPAPDLDGEG